MVTTSLDAMASGGMYDHLGGGFARYSVDARVARAPLREDALRPGAAGAGVPARRGRSPARRAVPPGARRDDRVRAARPAPPDGGFYSRRGRRLAEGDGGPGSTCGRPTRSRAVLDAERLAAAAIEWYGVTDDGNFEGATILNRTDRGDSSARPRSKRRGAALFAAREQPASVPASTTRSSPSGTRSSCRRSPRQPPRPATRLARRGRRQRRVPARELRDATADGAARGRPTTAAPATRASPPITPRSSTPSRGSPRPPARRGGSTRRARTADTLLDLFWDRRARRLVHHGDDAEALIAARRTCSTTPPVGQLAGRRRAGPARAPHRRAATRATPTDRALLGRPPGHPTAFAHLLERGRPAPTPASPRSRSSVTDPISLTPARSLPARTRCWRGASRTSHRCGRHVTPARTAPARPTSAVEPVEPPDTPDAQRPAYHLVGDVTIDGPVASAFLHATAHGLYEAFLNGSRVGDHELTPGFTAYRKRIQVQTFDVTDLVVEGPNTLGALLSDGWWRGQHGIIRADRCLRTHDGLPGRAARHPRHRPGARVRHRLVVAVDDGATSWPPTSSAARCTTSAVASPDGPTRRRPSRLGPGADRRARLRPAVPADRPARPPHRGAAGGVGDRGGARSPPRRLRAEQQRMDPPRRPRPRRDRGHDHLRRVARPRRRRSPRPTSSSARSRRHATSRCRSRPTSSISAGDGSSFEPRHSHQGLPVRPHRRPPRTDRPVAPSRASSCTPTSRRSAGSTAPTSASTGSTTSPSGASAATPATSPPTAPPASARAGSATGSSTSTRPPTSTTSPTGPPSGCATSPPTSSTSGAVTNIVPDPSPDAPIWKDGQGSAGWGDAAVHVPWELYRATGRTDVLARPVRVDEALGRLRRGARRPRSPSVAASSEAPTRSPTSATCGTAAGTSASGSNPA